MVKPKFVLYLPAGALAQLRPFARWVAAQPTCRVSGLCGEGAGESGDVVEFSTTLDWKYLTTTVRRLLAGHCPYRLVLNIPQCPGTRGDVAFACLNEERLVTGRQWTYLATPGRHEWRAAFLAKGASFSLFDALAPTYLAPAEFDSARNGAAFPHVLRLTHLRTGKGADTQRVRG